MSISFVNGAVATSAGSSVAGVAPAGLAIDDVMVALLSKDGGTTGTMDAPAGWTAASITAQLDVASLRSRAFYKVADAADLSSIGNFSNSLGGALQLIILAFRGVDPANPFVNKASIVDGGSTTSHAVGGGGVSPAGNAVGISMCGRNKGGGAATSWTVPSGYTAIYAPQADGGTEVVASYKLVSSGAFPTTTNTSVASDQCWNLLMALNELVVRSAVLTRRRQDRGLRLR